ncbi:MAG TPA: hypothetical protein VI895_09585, partial [Bdellovibrionota bacterium]|nr:hypothetical protein [Bdellovibrionota bacterium]
NLQRELRHPSLVAFVGSSHGEPGQLALFKPDAWNPNTGYVESVSALWFRATAGRELPLCLFLSCFGANDSPVYGNFSGTAATFISLKGLQTTMSAGLPLSGDEKVLLQALREGKNLNIWAPDFRGALAMTFDSAYLSPQELLAAREHMYQRSYESLAGSGTEEDLDQLINLYNSTRPARR